MIRGSQSTPGLGRGNTDLKTWVPILYPNGTQINTAENKWPAKGFTQTLLLKLLPEGKGFELIKDMGELDMDSPATLADFVGESLKNFPAERTVGAEVQADGICIEYLCVPVCVIEGGGASSTPA